MTEEFPCTSCGLCCQNLYTMHVENYKHHSPIMKFLIDKFPYKMNKKGVCEKLVNGLCSVYEDRPIICNVNLVGKLQGLDQDKWYEYVAIQCNKLITSNSLDSKYLVSVKK